jgi:DNA-damage-inducible protein J
MKKESGMPATDVVRARIDRRIKEEAAAILGAAGLTISDAFRMMLMRTVADKALPFDPLVPNSETIDAMKAARRGDLMTVGSVDDLLADLHADD